MSEIIVQPPGNQAIGPQFGLTVISQGVVRLVQELSDGSISAVGSDAADRIQADPIVGSASFRVSSGAGNDVITGGDAVDYLVGDTGNDQISGGASNDVVSGGAGNDTLRGNDGFDSILGGEGDDRIFGDAGNDNLVGGGGDDRINGGDGTDTVRAGVGNDIVFGDGGGDRLFGEAGDDQIFGGGSDDRIVGGAGDDLLDDGAGNDLLIGNSGDDTLVAGLGVDILRGGPGNDTFRITRRNGIPGLDRIEDFTPDQDVIQISQSLVPGSGLRPGQLTEGLFDVVTRISRSETATIVYEQRSGIVYYNPRQGADVPLFKLRPNLDLTAANASAFEIV